MSGAEPLLHGGGTGSHSQGGVDSLLPHHPSLFCFTNRSDVEQDPQTQTQTGFTFAAATLSKPIVVLDLVWNLAFILVALTALLTTLRETPTTPLRLWLCGYALLCIFHVAFLYLHFRTTTDYHQFFFFFYTPAHFRMFKRLESMNTITSSIWWVFGFYWIVVGGETLIQDSPRLYWLTVVFLAFDVFFVIFCVGMALVVFLALFCFIPILAVAYAVVASTEGASEHIIQGLPKHLYRAATTTAPLDNSSKLDGNNSSCHPNTTTNQLSLNPDDAECCICLCSYVDGAELSSLPCNHHFHSTCIRKWLLINATCPLCKFSILSRDTLV